MIMLTIIVTYFLIGILVGRKVVHREIAAGKCYKEIKKSRPKESFCFNYLPTCRETHNHLPVGTGEFTSELDISAISKVLVRGIVGWPAALVMLFALWNRPIGQPERDALSARITALEIANGIDQ